MSREEEIDLPESINELSPVILSAIANKVMSIFDDIEQDEAKGIGRTILQRKYKLSADELDIFLAETCLIGYKQGNTQVCGRAEDLISPHFKKNMGVRYKQMKQQHTIKNKENINMEDPVGYEKETEVITTEEEEVPLHDDKPKKQKSKPKLKPEKAKKPFNGKPFIYLFIVLVLAFFAFATYQNIKPKFSNANVETLNFIKPAAKTNKSKQSPQKELQKQNVQQTQIQKSAAADNKTINSTSSSLVFFEEKTPTQVPVQVVQDNRTVMAKQQPINATNNVNDINTRPIPDTKEAPQITPQQIPHQQEPNVAVNIPQAKKTQEIFNILKLKNIENDLTVLTLNDQQCFSYQKTIYCSKDQFYGNTILLVTKHFIRFYNDKEKFNYKLRIHND